MRADRLLAILLLLQRGGRTTAGALARRLEVSERTIYRDLEALGAAGVPVHSEPGRNGGVRLLEGYRTDLSGLSLSEAELVPLLGLSDVFAAVGAGAPLRQTEEKLLAALPADQRVRAEQSRRRLYVDLSRWWETTESVPHLATIVEAVFATRRLRIRYRRGGDAGEVRRTVDALGLVVQGGTWYLVARARRREVRIYRVSRILEAKTTDERFEVPDDFDLAEFWAQRKEAFHMGLPPYVVTLRALPAALRALGRSKAEVEAAGDGWTTTTAHFGTRWLARERLLGLGPQVEVLGPDELREDMVASLRSASALYVGVGSEHG